MPGFRLSYRYVNFVKKYGYLQVMFYYLLRQSVGLQHDQCQPPCPSTRLNSRPLKLLRLAVDPDCVERPDRRFPRRAS